MQKYEDLLGQIISSVCYQGFTMHFKVNSEGKIYIAKIVDEDGEYTSPESPVSLIDLLNEEEKPKMTIYQIIKAVGCYEDYHEYIVGTYLRKQKAESELARLKAEVPDCDECPYSEEGQNKPIETDCPHHKPYNFTVGKYYEEDDEDNENVYICKNCIDLYDAPSYRMEEYKVDESEE